MRAALLVRALTQAERAALSEGLCSGDVFTVRRCQIMLASGRQMHVPAIAQALGC